MANCPASGAEKRGNLMSSGAYRDRTGDPLLAKPSRAVRRRRPSLIFPLRHPCPAGGRRPAPVAFVTGIATTVIRRRDLLLRSRPRPGTASARQRTSLGAHRLHRQRSSLLAGPRSYRPSFCPLVAAGPPDPVWADAALPPAVPGSTLCDHLRRDLSQPDGRVER
jgi:hypothetical protein